MRTRSWATPTCAPSSSRAAVEDDALAAGCTFSPWRFGTIIAAQGSGLPVAPMISNIWMLPTRGAPAIGPGFAPPRAVLGRTRNAMVLSLANRVFDAALPALNTTRATYGLAPLRSFYEQVLSAPRILVLACPTFDFASPTVPHNARYVGPVLDEPCWAEPWTSPWPPDHPDPWS